MTDTLNARLRALVALAAEDHSIIGGTVSAFAPLIIEAADAVERFEAIELPSCPTCGGIGWIVVGQTMGDPYGEQNQCPDCPDGRMPLERCAAIARKVMGDERWDYDADAEIAYLRSVKP